MTPPYLEPTLCQCLPGSAKLRLRLPPPALCSMVLAVPPILLKQFEDITCTNPPRSEVIRCRCNIHRGATMISASGKSSALALGFRVVRAAVWLY
jgi:hypothetical protein